MSISGRNWGNATLDGATMTFAVGSKPAFRIPLKDVNQVQQNKEEVNDLPGCPCLQNRHRSRACRRHIEPVYPECHRAGQAIKVVTLQ